MPLNLHASIRIGLYAATTLLLLSGSAQAQRPCVPAADSALSAGWRYYRSDSLGKAVQNFVLVRRLCPANLDAAVGLGFSYLRLNRAREAGALFGSILSQDSANTDAWEGLTRSNLRLGDTTGAVAAGRRMLALSPGNAEIRQLLNTLAPDWERRSSPPAQRPTRLQVVARTRGRRFEIFERNEWRPFYIKGVNFGVALPGRYPAEFPRDSALYAGWLDTLAAMNANALRLYTILPPSFYRALKAWNLSHRERPLWLIQGVWTELPPHHNFQDSGWRQGFESEMRRVVDLIHGSANIAPRPGHAAGRYDADVSRWVLAYIIGREWEPFAVKAYDQRNPGGSYQGRYLQAERAPAMDLWLARECDLMLSYEVERYNALRPIAYTNWPTLDPLHHPTEATTQEEARWRRRSGRRSEARKLEYENDAIGLDANLIQPTPANPAGWFASYHAYPYYPDFMNLDPGYRRSRSSEGPSAYFGYLRQLVQHHPAIPTVIAEYGVPSSRGNAHLQVQGWSHGGHDEQAMAAIDARLTREIREAGAAGSVLFAWLDEWFKKNWTVIDYELPAENTRRWHNVMDPEQNYGVLGQYAGNGSSPRLGGNAGTWRGLAVIQQASQKETSRLRALRAGSDESFLYLSIELTPGGFPWDSFGVQLALDTYLPKTGQHRLPGTRTASELGFEFLIQLVNPDSASLRVTPEYNRYDARIDSLTGDDYGRFSRRPVLPRDREDGRFDPLLIIINRARFGRDGTFYPAQHYDRGKLRYGTEASSSLADWFLDDSAGLIELRIPWDLINVTDPSTRTILADPGVQRDFGTRTAETLHVGVELYRKGNRAESAGALPALVNGRWTAAAFKPWLWQGWTEPRSHGRLKPVYDSLRQLWREAPGEALARPGQRAPSD